MSPMGLMSRMSPMSRMGRMSRMSRMSLMSPMSRILFLLIIPLLAACSGSDPVEPMPTEEQKPISFCGTMLDEESMTPHAQAAPATRVAQGLEEVLTDKTFQVWGYKNDGYEAPSYTSYQVVMPGFTVNWGANTAHTTTSNTDEWEYVGQGPDQTIKYWDWSAKAYRFFGATNYGGDEPHEPHEANKTYGAYGPHEPYETYTLSASVSADNVDAAPYFSRLWFSDGNAAIYPKRQFGRPVQLEFLKPFARVRFLFTFVEGLSFDRESLKNIRFYPTPHAGGTPPTIATAGTVAVSYPLKGTDTAESWAVTPGTGASDHIDAFTIDYYETPVPGTVPAGYPVDEQPTSWPNTPEHWYVVIPAPSQGSYTAVVAVGTNEIKSVVIPAEYMSWKAGYEYTYKFKITEGGGLNFDIIQSGINNWTSRGASDHEFYNW